MILLPHFSLPLSAALPLTCNGSAAFSLRESGCPDWSCEFPRFRDVASSHASHCQHLLTPRSVR